MAQASTFPRLSFPSGSTLQKPRLRRVCPELKQRPGDRDPQQRRRTRPPPSTQGSEPLTLSRSGWAGGGAAGRGFRVSGVLAAQAEGSGADKARSRPAQAAPPLLGLGETTASGGGCGMRDAAAAANRSAGRRPGAMATANGGPRAGTSGGSGTSRLRAGSGTACAKGGEPPPREGGAPWSRAPCPPHVPE